MSDDKEGYGFTLDADDFIQVGETRFFEINASKEAVERFVEDMKLFEDEQSSS